MSRVIVAGGTGFIGRHIVAQLSADHEIVVLSRSNQTVSNARIAQWDGKSLGEWAKELDGATAVINFTGASIQKRWTDPYRKTLLQSRIEPTNAIGIAIQSCANPPKVWINGSATGYYGDPGLASVGEQNKAGGDFLAQLCVEWERAATTFNLDQTRLVLMRTGPVLAKDGGMFPLMAKMTKLFLGGTLGRGTQGVPWIHVHDLVRMIEWLVLNDFAGPINGISPNPVSNQELMAHLREALGRPPVPAAPEPLVRLGTALLGLEAELILTGQYAYPVLAEAHGFKWHYPTLSDALHDLV